jgi:hypothetical protein
MLQTSVVAVLPTYHGKKAGGLSPGLEPQWWVVLLMHMWVVVVQKSIVSG